MSFKRWTAWASGLAITGLATFANAAVQGEDGLGYPRDASVDGHKIDWLINVTMGFTILLFVVMCIWMAWACIQHGRGHTAEYDHGNGRHSVMTAILISGVIFAVVDGNLFVNSVVDMEQTFWNWDKPENDPDTVRIEVNAHQWAWDARYAGPDGEFNTADDIVTLNDITVPKGAPVLIQLASVDVIHNFYLPNFRIKMDAMPGMINRLWFEAKETGDFDIACAQHCGTHHYKMKGKLTVLEPDEFAAWSSHASALALRAYDPEDAGAHWGWTWKKEF